MSEGPPERKPWLHPQAAYVHLPFCAHHCGYCDFAVAVGQDGRMEEFVDALALELSSLGQPWPVRTLFFGGGTPSYLPADKLERVLRLMQRWLPLLPGHEFSVEVNPDDLEPGKVALLADYGVNRVSVGVQSFEPRLLALLERRHRADEVPRAIELLRRRFENLSLDLIFGVPTQTLAEWQQDLARALALGPAHLATYGLTFEKGTRLWKQRRRGELQPLTEELELACYQEAMARLEAAGFEHYEISNFARPGFRCRHNETYWANHAHLGFGVGAAAYREGTRTLNTRDLATYLRRLQSGESPVFQRETLPPRERALETLAIQLRRSDGVARGAFREQTGFDLDALVAGKLHRLGELDLVVDHGERIALTRRGKCVADAVIAEFL